MDDAVPHRQTDDWDQGLKPLVTVLPYALLVLLAGVTVGVKHGTPGSLLIDLALCAALAGWMLWMITWHPAGMARPARMAVFLAVLLALTAVLVLRDPWFGFFTPAAYLFTFRLLPWPGRLLGVAAVAVIAGIAQTSEITGGSAEVAVVRLAVIAANVLPMCGFAWIDWRGDRREDERDRALAEARESNRRLTESMAENARLHERLMDQARQAGVQDERGRMAREIHDTLAQGLTGIITQLQAAELDGQDPAERSRHVAAATRLARESLSEARRSVEALRPEPLETARLGEALTAVADRWSALHRVPVEVTTTGTARSMRPDVEFVLLRTVQEALSNVARHAGAGRVGVTLSYMEDEVAVDVRDDGRGFDPSIPAGDGGERGGDGGGFGLVAMRQRIEGLAGTLQIESEPGAGTAVCAWVPAGAPA
jgi:signal transduction histidine kinase